MPDEDKIKPNFEPDNTKLSPAINNGADYERVIPEMKELIRKNKEEIEKLNLDVSSPNNNDVRK